MFFEDASSRARLNEIIRWAAIGETTGVLANMMSPAERTEKLTPEGILPLTTEEASNSKTSELLRATVVGLNAAVLIGSPTNLDIRIHIHQAYREWATSSLIAAKFGNQSLVRAITSGQVGSFTSRERGTSAGMLFVAPIGLAFAYDPGRAFLIGAEASALVDGEFNSYLSAGVVSLIIAVLANGCCLQEAIGEARQFIRPLDWPGEVSEALRRCADMETALPFSSGSTSEVLRTGISAAQNATSEAAAVSGLLLAGGDATGAALAAQFAVMCPQAECA